MEIPPPVPDVAPRYEMPPEPEVHQHMPDIEETPEPEPEPEPVSDSILNVRCTR